MTRTQLILIAAGGSAAMLAGAYGFEIIGGMAPCQLCWWQRYAHMTAVIIGVLALVLKGRSLPYLGAAATLSGAGIALFHTGVERGWWEGLASCSGGSIIGVSVEDLLNPAAPIAAPIRCDQAAWDMLGLSMASWNGLACVALAIIWLLAAAKRR